MSQSARVQSIDLLKDFQAALARFGAEAQQALCAAGLAVRHAVEELDERLKHWQRMVRERREDVGRARAALAHRRALMEGSRSGCSELEMELEQALRRQREAEEKVETVRRWQRQLPEAIEQFDGPVRLLAGHVEGDFKHGLAILQERIAALEAYAALAIPAPTEPTPEGNQP
jgi:chromosome segregation ATPase